MDIFGTVVTCLSLAQKCTVIINKVQAWPNELRQVTRRIARLEVLLRGLNSHLKKMPKHGLDRLAQEQRNELGIIITDTKTHCESTHELLVGWESRKIGTTEIEFREGWLGDFFYKASQVYGGKAESLKSLAKDLDDDRRDLVEYMGLLGIRQDQANHDALADQNEQMMKKIDELTSKLAKLMDGATKQKKTGNDDRALAKKQVDAVQATLASLNQSLAVPPLDARQRRGSASDGEGNGQQSVTPPGRQPTPDVSRLRRDYKILFVAPHNQGRDVVSELLVKLLGAWTESANGDWRIKKVQSAGFFERENGDCAEVIEGLDFQHKSYKLAMSDKSMAPNPTAMAALFDNTNYDFIPGGFKAKLQKTAEKTRSKGIKRNVFKEFDYIIVFTRREHNNMLKLRNALVAIDGPGTVVKGKGRVVHLGQYLASSGNTKEIFNPLKDEKGQDSRENWNKKVLDLKIAIKKFLATELNWTQPPVKVIKK